MEIVEMKTILYGKEFMWKGLIWEAPCIEWIDFPSPTHWRSIDSICDSLNS